MHKVFYNGRRHNVSSHFFCRIRPEWLLRDAERNV